MNIASTIIGDIKRERARQELEYGGSVHDDLHTPGEWWAILDHQCQRIRGGYQEVGPAYRSSAVYRDLLVKVAAVAVAALQAWGRFAGQQRSLMQAFVVNPMDATVGELMAVLKASNAAFLKVVQQQGDEPTMAFLGLADGPALQPTLDILDAISSTDTPHQVRQRVLAALDALDAGYPLEVVQS